MPLQEGNSKKVVDQNFHEFRHGKTFAKTEKKFGKAKADAQLEAVVLGTAGIKPKESQGFSKLTGK